ncbi:hypothetical protein [Candidatus Neptunochlamydia vexilliferae]|uniref:Uncharacterized protein n=1 Tax=Candidatus Neptunichlamydia vexilliferae TaxID=1651774 RepID=A0ABS0B1B5_9BACT|nr:hypothetical protein [Candidatus Neptunochlamydia vexilliferae]MBF5060198.1 hypothetical protein [Candidatus Neptunochlamydia vexilliferae]
MSKGVMTGCDDRQEWMLKWWWKHYSEHNDYPVIFWDFGMSPAAKAWCANRGEVVSFDANLNLQKNDTAPWADKVSKSVWERRKVWFSKPLILKESPFEETIWTDIDCEVKQNLSPLFEMTRSKDGFAISYDSEKNIAEARRWSTLKEGVRGVQAGVFAYRQNSPLVLEWIDYCMRHLGEENSDQSALSHLLHEKPFDITIFSDKYNWLLPEVPNPHATIVHHTGVGRKRALLTAMRF